MKFTKPESELLCDLCVPRNAPDCLIEPERRVLVRAMQARGFLTVTVCGSDGTPTSVRLTDLGYAEALRAGGMRHRWGMVKIEVGPHRGKFGYYDEEDETGELAVVLLPSGSLDTHENLLQLRWVHDYMVNREGRSVLVPLRHLRPFESREEEAAARARFAPGELIGDAARWRHIEDVLTECGIGDTGDDDVNLALLRSVLEQAKALGLKPAHAT